MSSSTENSKLLQEITNFTCSREKDDSCGFQLLWQVTNRVDHNPPLLYQPYDVTFNGENVILAEGCWPFSRLQIFSDKGRSVLSIGQGRILPYGVAMNAQGNVVTTDHHDRTIKIFTTGGEELLSWKEALFEWPTGVAVDQSGRYHISDWLLGTVSIHDECGEKVRKFRTVSTDRATFSCPSYLACDFHNRIIVSDAFDRSVKVFDNSGRLLLKLENGSGREKFVDPRGVCADEQSNFIVADWNNSQVKLYSPDGRWIKDLLNAEDGIQHPRAVALSKSNLLVITEQKLNSVPSLKVLDLRSTSNK